MSPQSLAPEITVTDADLHAAYDQQKSEYQTAEKRSAEVISAPDEAKAQTLGGDVARRGGLDRDAGGGEGGGRLGDRPGRRDRGAVSRSRPGEGGVLGAGGRGVANR